MFHMQGLSLALLGTLPAVPYIYGCSGAKVRLGERGFGLSCLAEKLSLHKRAPFGRPPLTQPCVLAERKRPVSSGQRHFLLSHVPGVCICLWGFFPVSQRALWRSSRPWQYCQAWLQEAPDSHGVGSSPASFGPPLNSPPRLGKMFWEDGRVRVFLNRIHSCPVNKYLNLYRMPRPVLALEIGGTGQTRSCRWSWYSDVGNIREQVK